MKSDDPEDTQLSERDLETIQMVLKDMKTPEFQAYLALFGVPVDEPEYT